MVSFQWKKLINTIEEISTINNKNKYKLFLVTFFSLIQSHLFKWPILYYLLKKDNNILNKDFLRRFQVYNYDHMNKGLSITSPKKYQYYEINNVSHQKGFEIIDQGTSIFSIETRHPFYDKRLIEFCYAIPTEMKLKSGFSRYILRISMYGILPEEIRWRTTKANIARASILNFLSEKNILERVINDHHGIIRDYINLDKLQMAFKSVSKYNSSISKLFLWRVVLIYLWLNKKFYITIEK